MSTFRHPFSSTPTPNPKPSKSYLTHLHLTFPSTIVGLLPETNMSRCVALTRLIYIYIYIKTLAEQCVCLPLLFRLKRLNHPTQNDTEGD